MDICLFLVDIRDSARKRLEESKMKRFLALAMSCALMVSALAGCGNSSSGGSNSSGGSTSGDKVVKIGVFEPPPATPLPAARRKCWACSSPTPRPPLSPWARRVQGGIGLRGQWLLHRQGSHRAAQLVSEGVALVLGSYGSGVSIAAGPHLPAARASPPSA